MLKLISKLLRKLFRTTLLPHPKPTLTAKEYDEAVAKLVKGDLSFQEFVDMRPPVPTPPYPGKKRK